MHELATTPSEERAIWYGHVANITAYNLQYEENLTPDYDFDTFASKEDLSGDLVGELSSLMYNIYTNDGNCFLQQKWIDLLQGMIDRDLEPISKFKKAGEQSGFDMRGIK